MADKSREERSHNILSVNAAAPVSMDKAPFLCSQRMVLVVLIFWGALSAYIARVNLSMAILCMVRTDVTGVGLTNMTSGNGTDLIETTTSPVAGHCSGGGETGSPTTSYDGAEFEWSKSTRATLLAMYFYGYIVTQFPGGWLAVRFGGHKMFTVSMSVSAVCTLVTPVCTRTHVYLAYGARFILGLSAGLMFPCVHTLMGKWGPVYERSKMIAFSAAGTPIGVIAMFAISGVLCEYGFDNGWGSIFYLSGLCCALWVVAWSLLMTESPAEHKRISTRERRYIETSLSKASTGQVREIPWIRMMTSRPVWGIILAHVTNNWVNYTMITSLPMFMKESLKFDIKRNGLLSAAPFACQFLSCLLAGHVADTLRERRILSTKTVRKAFQCTSLVGMAVCLVSAVQMTCEQRHFVIIFLCLCMAFMGLSRVGYMVNHLDIAPSYAGLLFGITNTVATIPGMLAPLVVGALTPNRSTEEWKMVFYVCAAIAASGAVLYILLADGELQEWAIPPEDKKYVEFSINFSPLLSNSLEGKEAGGGAGSA